MNAIIEGLAPYGATLDCEGYIYRRGTQTSVKPVIRGKRLRFETPQGTLIASGPLNAKWVGEFVSKYWFWEPEIKKEISQ